MHVTTVSNAIKKHGQLDDYKKAVWKYARAGLLLLGESVRKPRKEKKKTKEGKRWLQQRQRSVCPKPRIPFFLFTSIGVQK